MIRFSRTMDVYSEFSNFDPVEFIFDNRKFKNSEAAFQYGKYRPGEETDALCTVSGAVAKRLGRQIHIRPDWDDMRYCRMKDVLLAKFSQSEKHKQLLLSTGNQWLVELTSWHDNTWGICECARCKKKLSENMLGLALMEVRAILRGQGTCFVEFSLLGENYRLDLWGDAVARAKVLGTWPTILNTINRYGSSLVEGKEIIS